MLGIYQIQIQIKINFINIFHEIFIYFFQILKKIMQITNIKIKNMQNIKIKDKKAKDLCKVLR